MLLLCVVDFLWRCVRCCCRAAGRAVALSASAHLLLLCCCLLRQGQRRCEAEALKSALCGLWEGPLWPVIRVWGVSLLVCSSSRRHIKQLETVHCPATKNALQQASTSKTHCYASQALHRRAQEALLPRGGGSLALFEQQQGRGRDEVVVALHAVTPKQCYKGMLLHCLLAARRAGRACVGLWSRRPFRTRCGTKRSCLEILEVSKTPA